MRGRAQTLLLVRGEGRGPARQRDQLGGGAFAVLVGRDLLVVDIKTDQAFDGQQFRSQRVDPRPDPGQGLFLLGDLPGERVRGDPLPLAGGREPWRGELGVGEPVSVGEQRGGELGDQAGLDPLAEVVDLVPGRRRGNVTATGEVLPRFRRGEPEQRPRRWTVAGVGEPSQHPAQHPVQRRGPTRLVGRVDRPRGHPP